MGTRASPLFAATILIAASTSCGETSVTRFETVEAARRQGLFDRGWVPDVLPAAAGPLTEAHNIDTNTRCAYGQFAPLAFEAVEAALSKAGFEPNGGALRPIPFAACSFTQEDAARTSSLLRRSADNGEFEFAAIDRTGRFYYWSAR
jgi:hypothetical protein